MKKCGSCWHGEQTVYKGKIDYVCHMTGGIVENEEVINCECYDEEVMVAKSCDTCHYKKYPIDRFGYGPCIGCKNFKNWKQKLDSNQ